MESWKTKVVIIGVIVGAVAGVIAGLLFIQRAQESQEAPKLTAGDGVKVGVGVLGVLKLISDLGSGRK
jgi:hypothetical protein